jgi:fengycin family lipopeptide synthetase D
VPEEMRFDPLNLIKFLKENNAAVCDGTPAHLGMILNYPEELAEGFPVEKFFVGGDALDPALAAKLLETNGTQGFKLINGYGPTECSDISSLYLLTGKTAGNTARTPIGKPIPNVKYYILDQDGQLQPPGIPGELYIGGDGQARGYVNRPELTAEKFVPSPFTPHSSRLYKTGDMARWQPDGNVEFLARVDDQVKIRGFRVEPSEVQAQIQAQAPVEQAAVISRKDGSGENYLCAYIVSRETPDPEQLKNSLSAALPAYMIPPYIVQIESMPLTPHGKVDRGALPVPQEVITGEYTAPVNEIEEKLTEIWSEILAIDKDKISTGADFFQMGGHSLRATQMAAKIHKEFDMNIPLVDIFKTPTIKGIASLLDIAGWLLQEVEGNPGEKEEFTL